MHFQAQTIYIFISCLWPNTQYAVIFVRSLSLFALFVFRRKCLVKFEIPKNTLYVCVVSFSVLLISLPYNCSHSFCEVMNYIYETHHFHEVNFVILLTNTCVSVFFSIDFLQINVIASKANCKCRNNT